MQTWKTFLRNHAEGIASIDVFVVRRFPLSSSMHFLFLATDDGGCCGPR